MGRLKLCMILYNVRSGQSFGNSSKTQNSIQSYENHCFVHLILNINLNEQIRMASSSYIKILTLKLMKFEDYIRPD